MLSSHINDDDGDPVNHDFSVAPHDERPASTDLPAECQASADDPWLRSDKIHSRGSCYKGKDDGNVSLHHEDSSTNVN